MKLNKIETSKGTQYFGTSRRSGTVVINQRQNKQREQRFEVLGLKFQTLQDTINYINKFLEEYTT